VLAELDFVDFFRRSNSNVNYPRWDLSVPSEGRIDNYFVPTADYLVGRSLFHPCDMSDKETAGNYRCYSRNFQRIDCSRHCNTSAAGNNIGVDAILLHSYLQGKQ
jgi:hypothetical protein